MSHWTDGLPWKRRVKNYPYYKQKENRFNNLKARNRAKNRAALKSRKQNRKK